MINQAYLSNISEDITPGFACRPNQDKSGALQLRPYSITSEGKIDLSQSKFVKCDNAQLLKYKLEEGDILFNNTNSPELVGKTALFSDKINCVFSNHITRIRINKESADPGYIARYLNNLFTTKVFYTRCQQWVNQAAIPKTELGKLSVPLPPITVQRKISSILEKAESAREKRREANRLTDEFLKSSFLDMFGDPLRNEKKWKKVRAGDFVDVLTGYAFKSNEYVDNKNGVKLCGGLIVLPGKIEWLKANHWSKNNTAGLKQFWLANNDIVIAMDRPWIQSGFKIGVIKKDDLPALLVQRTARLRGKGINQFYLYYTFKHKAFEVQCKPTETTVPHISPNDIKSYKIPLPPIDLQQKFADLVQKVETLKEKQRKSEKELDNLFNSLMQRAFRGEIT